MFQMDIAEEYIQMVVITMANSRTIEEMDMENALSLVIKCKKAFGLMVK